MTLNPQLKKNYQQVLDRIEKAALAADRDADEIQLVAVTKYVDAEIVRALYELGCRHFGESRPQVLWQKSQELSDLPIHWHMIGHLQTNKARRTLPHIHLLHSGDSVKMLEVLNEEARRVDATVDVLCEVNISGDPAKHGFSPDELSQALQEVSSFEGIRIKGLMAMASRMGGADKAAGDFEKMFRLREQFKDSVPSHVSLRELSMGMSGDFEQAIAWGATLVRVGSILFEGI